MSDPLKPLAVVGLVLLAAGAWFFLRPSPTPSRVVSDSTDAAPIALADTGPDASPPPDAALADAAPSPVPAREPDGGGASRPTGVATPSPRKNTRDEAWAAIEISLARWFPADQRHKAAGILRDMCDQVDILSRDAAAAAAEQGRLDAGIRAIDKAGWAGVREVNAISEEAFRTLKDLPGAEFTWSDFRSLRQLHGWNDACPSLSQSFDD
jgi:hypothetical protein